MKFPLSEIADRWSILRLKAERLPEDNTIIEVFAVFTAELDNEIHKFDVKKRNELKCLIAELYLHNADIWDLEADIRSGKINESKELNEIGKRAVLIRDHNKKRLNVKNKIAIMVAQRYAIDKKIDHGSE